MVELEALGAQILVVMAAHYQINAGCLADARERSLGIQRIRPLAVLAERVGRLVHEYDLPVLVGGAHIVEQPAKLRERQAQRVVGVQHGEMRVAVVVGIVDAVQILHAFGLVQIEHIVEPVPHAQTIMVAADRRERYAAVKAVERLGIVVPFFVGAVVGEVAEIDDEVCVRIHFQTLFRGTHALEEILKTARLHVRDADEADLVVAVVRAECARLAPGCVALELIGVVRACRQALDRDFVHVVAFPCRARHIVELERRGDVAPVCEHADLRVDCRLRIPAETALRGCVAVDGAALAEQIAVLRIARVCNQSAAAQQRHDQQNADTFPNRIFHDFRFLSVFDAYSLAQTNSVCQ